MVNRLNLSVVFTFVVYGFTTMSLWWHIGNKNALRAKWNRSYGWDIAGVYRRAWSQQRRGGLCGSVGEGDVAVSCLFSFCIVEEKRREMTLPLWIQSENYSAFVETGETDNAVAVDWRENYRRQRGAAVKGQTNAWRCEGGVELCKPAAYFWIHYSPLFFSLCLNVTPHVLYSSCCS